MKVLYLYNFALGTSFFPSSASIKSLNFLLYTHKSLTARSSVWQKELGDWMCSKIHGAFGEEVEGNLGQVEICIVFSSTVCWFNLLVSQSFNVVVYVQFRCFHLYDFASGMSFFPSFTSPQFSCSTYMLLSQREAQLGRNNWEIGLVEHGVLGRR